MTLPLLSQLKPPPPDVKLRNRIGIKGIFDRNMDPRAKVTLERAIEILKAGW
jgi:hypothetical protein